MDPDALTQNWGFSRYPFRGAFEAGREEDLHSYFLEPPYFRDILGDPREPTSSIVFGSRGDGKTAICKMIIYHLQSETADRVLIVRYDDFSRWTQQEIVELSLDSHIEAILGLAVEKFIQELERCPSLLEALETDARSTLQWFVLRFLPAAGYAQAEARLISLFDQIPQSRRFRRFGRMWFRRAASYLRRKRVEVETVGDSESKVVQLTKLVFVLLPLSHPGVTGLQSETMLALLKRFRDLVLSAGFDSMYIMVDKVDETEPCSGSYSLAAQLVSPIVGSLVYLELPQIATKLFLPTVIRDMLTVTPRTDRITTRNISWTQERLKALLKKRLLAFSGDKIGSLEPFVDPSIWDQFERKVLHYSALCPRNLLRLLEHIVGELCELEEVPKRVTAAAMDAGIDHFLTFRFGEEHSAEYRSRIEESHEQLPPSGSLDSAGT